jgi:hypothetical protein
MKDAIEFAEFAVAAMKVKKALFLLFQVIKCFWFCHFISGKQRAISSRTIARGVEKVMKLILDF